MLHKLLVLGTLCKSWKANTTIFYTILFSLCSSTSTGPLLASNLNAFLFTVWAVGLSISIFRLPTVYGLLLSYLPLLNRPLLSLLKPSLPPLEKTQRLCQVWVHGNDVTALAQWESPLWPSSSLPPWFADRRWTGCGQTYATRPMFSVLVPLAFSELLPHHKASFSVTSSMPPFGAQWNNVCIGHLTAASPLR